MYQHYSSTCIWSIYLSSDAIFQNLWFILWFPWYKVADYKEATELRVLSGYSCTFTAMTWLTVTEYLFINDHGYVSFVVITTLSFPHSWIITVFTTRVTTGATSGSRTAYPSGSHEFIPCFQWSSCCPYCQITYIRVITTFGQSLFQYLWFEVHIHVIFGIYIT
jgi:hypothetical protein